MISLRSRRDVQKPLASLVNLMWCSVNEIYLTENNGIQMKCSDYHVNPLNSITSQVSSLNTWFLKSIMTLNVT